MPTSWPAANPSQFPCGDPVDSEAAFEALVAWLPEMLRTLLACEPYNVEKRPPSGVHGLYLFSQEERHLYVGRTGITASARSGRTGSMAGFRRRFDSHVQPGRPPGTAAFANRLMLEKAHTLGMTVPAGWWDERAGAASAIHALFLEAKDRIGRMDCRIVAFDDDARGVRSTVAETYVHATLQTPYNHFSTS